MQVIDIKMKDGFTLIELMVVLAITSILSNLAIIKYADYIEYIRDKEQQFITLHVKNVLLTLEEPVQPLGPGWESSAHSYYMRMDSTRGEHDIRKTFNNTGIYFDSMQIPTDLEISGSYYKDNSNNKIVLRVETRRCANDKSFIFFVDPDSREEVFYSSFDQTMSARCGTTE